MNRRKIITLYLSAAIIVVIGICAIKYTSSAKPGENIKLMGYTSPTVTGDDGYQIEMYEKVEANEWINENEVLTLTKKDNFRNPDSITSVRYCSIYNLNTKESKDFPDVNIDETLGVSPDKKYFLYAEPRVIPEFFYEGNIQTEESKKAYESGNLYHKKVKLLNFFTGEITDVSTEKVNSFAEFKWVGNNKILQSYCSGKWKITDISGKACVEGSYNCRENELVRIAGTDDIKDLGDSAEGKFYYTQDVDGKNGGRISTKLCTIDIKTKEVKTIYTSKNSLRGSKKGKTIAMDNYTDSGAVVNGVVNGVVENGTFGEVLMDESGKLIRSIDCSKGINHTAYILSPDGRKATYLEYDNQIGFDNKQTTLKVIDIKTGNVYEIVKVLNLKDENEEAEYKHITVEDNDGRKKEGKMKSENFIGNICWSDDGGYLSFTNGDSKFSNKIINTYIVSFDKYKY
jgi:hypothetical protein